MSSQTDVVEPVRSFGTAYPTSSPLWDIPFAADGWVQVFDVNMVYQRLVEALLNAQMSSPEYAAQLRAWIDEQQHAEVRSFLWREAARHDCVSVVVGDWEDDGVDLLFVVEGDLYDGESAVLPIMRRLRSAFPSIAFDVMILPERIYTPQFPWGDASEVLYRRQQAMT
jgi:hypothetical protein